MKVFVLEIDHVSEPTGEETIRIFGKTEDGKKVLIIDRYEYYIYALPKEGMLNSLLEKLKKHPSVRRTEVCKKKYLGKEREVIKVYVSWRDVSDVKEYIKSLEEAEGKKEIDISPHRKYIVDKKIFPFHWYEVSGEELHVPYDCDIAIKLKDIKSSDHEKHEIKILAFDIEVYSAGKGFPDSKTDPVISISFYSKDFKKVITWKEPKEKKDYYIIVKNEYELFEKFEEVIRKYDPDILVGYNSNNFDIYYLYERAKILNYKFTLGFEKKGFVMLKKREQSKKFKIHGIPHVDIYEFIANIFGAQLQTATLSLDEVAKELLGENKIELSWDEFEKIWESGKNIEKILEYNLRDSELTYKLAEKYIPIILELTRIVGQNVIDVAHMTYGQLVEWYLIKRSRDFNEIVPNRPKPEDVEKRRMITYMGAYVFEPKPGMYSNIVVYDFRSLYPSIIILHNVSPDTLNCEHKECKTENSKEIVLSTGKKIVWFCKKKKGFIPTVLEEIFNERAQLKKQLKSLDKNDPKYPLIYSRQYSLKILANSMYGYMGFPNSRWYCMDCAAAVTAWGREYIKRIASLAKSWGFKVIYGDTDSIFLEVKNKDKALEFLNHVNSHELKRPMELELEDFYIRGIFVSKRTEFVEGAKKKYALLSEQGAIKLRGFETVRRDWAPIAKETQRKVIEILLREGSIEKAKKYVNEIISKLRRHEIPVKKLVIHEQLRKDLSEYKSEGPHVVIAKRLKEMGYPVGPGFVIRYVIVKGGERIKDKVKLPEEVSQKDYDPDYYINHQILPAVERIFLAVGITKESLKSGGQVSLSKFFK